jgi:hypothetical protein
MIFRKRKKVGEGMFKKKICFILSFSLFTGIAFCLPTGNELLTKIQVNMDMKSDIKANVKLTQQKTEQGIKNIELIYYRRDKDDNFLIIMTAPEVEKGNGYLRTGDNFWMYRRNTRTFQHINRDESIAGTNAKGDDFEKKKLTDLYVANKDKAGKEMITEENLGNVPVYKMEVIAKVNDVDYPKKIMWVQKDKNLTLKEQSFSSTGTLMETAYFLQYTTVNGQYIPIKQIYIDEFEKGNKTIVEISAIATDKLEDKIFTKAYLENLSK